MWKIKSVDVKVKKSMVFKISITRALEKLKILLWLFYKQNNLNEYLLAGETLRKVSSFGKSQFGGT